MTHVLAQVTSLHIMLHFMLQIARFLDNSGETIGGLQVYPSWKIITSPAVTSCPTSSPHLYQRSQLVLWAL